MNTINHSFNSSHTFFGGASLLIQYKDALKPVNLIAFIKMLYDKSLRHGLPFEIIEKFSLYSVMEFYTSRTHINPLRQLDYKHKSPEIVDSILSNILTDTSIYVLSPYLLTAKLIQVMRSQNFSIPIFIYNETYDKGIELDTPNISSSAQFVYGSIKDILNQIPNNSTMIFSNIEHLVEVIKEAPKKMLLNLLITSDYQYNFNSNLEYKYNLSDVITKEFKPFIKASNINVFNKVKIIQEILSLFK